MPDKNSKNRLKQVSRVMVVADCPLIIGALSRAVDMQEDMKVCGRAEDADLAVEAVKALEPDIVIIDILLSAANDLNLVRVLKNMFPDLPTAVLSLHNDPIAAVRFLRAGARGFIAKKENVGNIIEAVRKVLKGHIWISEEITTEVLQKWLETDSAKKNINAILTKRELEVFELIGTGLSTEKVAKQLFISQRTVESHRDHIKKKLNIEDLVSLHKMAFQWVQSKNEI